LIKHGKLPTEPSLECRDFKARGRRASPTDRDDMVRDRRDATRSGGTSEALCDLPIDPQQQGVARRVYRWLHAETDERCHPGVVWGAVIAKGDMPGIDGLECRTLQHHGRAKTAVFSGHSEVAHLPTASSMAVDPYLTRDNGDCTDSAAVVPIADKPRPGGARGGVPTQPVESASVRQVGEICFK
jgi:hypothetical protein